MNYSHKKVIIADVDETICESCQVISDAMAEKINALIKRRYTIAFVSGTDQSELQRMISSKVKEEHHILANTGTHYCIVKDNKEEEIHNEKLDSSERELITEAIHNVIKKFSLIPLTSREDQVQDRGSQITFSILGRNAPSEIKKKYDPVGKKRQEFTTEIAKLLGEESTNFEIKIGGTTSIDITKKGTDKEWAIRRFAEYHNIPFSEILFFGDKIYPGGNDYPASKVVDCISVKNPDETLEKLQEIFP